MQHALENITCKVLSTQMVHRTYTIVESVEQPMDADKCMNGCCSEKENTPEKKPRRNLNIVETESQEEIPVTPAKPKKRDYVIVSTEEQLPSPKNVMKLEKPKTVKETLQELKNFQELKKAKQNLKDTMPRRDVTSMKRLNENVIAKVAQKCKSCTAQKRCCSELSFSVVRHVRSILYGPQMNRTKRRKMIMSWLAQIEQMSVAQRLETKGKSSSSYERVRCYFIFDFSFSRQDSNIEPLLCCKDCFVNVLGISAATLSSFWKSLRESDMKVEEATSECAQKGFEKSPERLACHAWMEYFVAQQACLSPDQHKSELAAVTTIKDMHEMFADDWKTGVMSGTNYRKHRGSGKRGRRVPGDVAEKKQVDEDGAFEVSDAVKRALMAKHPPPSYSFFCKVWKSDFSGDYKIPRHHRRFTQCNWCAELKSNLKHATDPEDRLYYKKCLYDHYKWITEQRHKYYKHRKKAEMHPSK
jgi:hypothetical protein